MALYEELQKGNIYGGLERAIRANVLSPMNTDGLIRRNLILVPGQMWIHTKHSVERDCDLWNTVYFRHLNFIPKGCRSCWKVCFRPRTLKEAIATNLLQEKMDLPSKVGMESRPTTAAEGGFNAFWYAHLADGLEGGRELWKNVKEALKETFGDEIDEPILKRGCTEMEHKFPPSSKWDEYAQQADWDIIEGLGNEVVLPYKGPERQPSVVKRNIMVQWIEWGFEHSKATGDFTYKEYIEGNMLPDLEQYQRSIHSTKDFKSTWEERNGLDNNKYDDAETQKGGNGRSKGSAESLYGNDGGDSTGGIEVVKGLASA